MKLLDDIKQSPELQEYWKSLLGQKRLDEILKQPKLVEHTENCEKRANLEQIQEASRRLVNVINYTEYIEFEQEVAFAPFFQYIAGYIKEELKSSLAGFIQESVIHHVVLQIVELLSPQCMRCLIEEMHSLKREERLAGEKSTEEYDYFCKIYLKDFSYVKKLLVKYSILTELIAEKVTFSVEYVLEIFEHLKKDRQDIIWQLCDKKGFRSVNDIWMNLSDEHFPGKTVAKIRLDNGYVIYHKPHDLLSAVYYHKVQCWVFEKCGLDCFPYRILSRENYGWEQEVLALSCHSQREIESYYTRVGIQVCLAYILGITDLHFENIIPHGEYPVIVDMEFIADRRLSDYVHSENMGDILKDTVANTGLLPTATGDGSGVNVGGLGEIAEQTASYKMPVVIHPGTSDMAITYREPKVDSGRSLPVWNGKKTDYREYIPFIVDGFTKAYQTVLHNKKEFVRNFADDVELKSRFLFRSTQEYFMYQNTMNFPALLKNREERRLMLFHMDKGLYCNERYRKEILNYEIDSVYHHIIPVFYAHGKDLYMGNGERLRDYFSYDGKKQILSRMEKLSRGDYGLQRKVMETIFLSQWKQRHKACILGNRESLTLAEMSPERIADLLAEDMLLCKDKFGWVGIHYSSSGKIYPGVVDLYLYNGLCGIAIFFAALCKQNTAERYSHICQKVIATLLDHTDKACSGNFETDDKWGLFTGEASFAYTYLILYEITGERIFLEYAGKHGRLIIKNLERINGCDLLSGKAGVIVALVYVYEKTGEDFLLDAAESLADILKKEATIMEKGIGWKEHGDIPLAGVAHGNSGIALAFAYLYRCTPRLEYLNIIKDAICYEDSLYDIEKKNWMDLRNYQENKEDRQDTVAWCHGAAGILAARMAIHRITGLGMMILFGIASSSGINKDFLSIDVAINNIAEKIGQSKKADWCLCHGNMGLLTIMDEYLADVNIKCDNAWETGHDRLSVEDRNNPGFMTGLSGIGYMLLRKHDKSLPGVFIFS